MQKSKIKIPAGGFRFHEAANIFPMMGETELQQLTADIERNDQEERIKVVGDQIIDGRNRYRALQRLGFHEEAWRFVDVSQEFRYPLDDPKTPVDYVLSQNLHRRHLNEAQRAAVAVEVKKLERKAAKERQKTSTGGSDPQLKENLPEAGNGQARDIAAEKLGVSGRSVDHAENVLDSPSAVPELKDAVRKGKVAVSSAAVVAGLPQADQRKAVAEGKKGVAQAAKRARKTAFDLKYEEQHAGSAVRRILSAWPREYHHIAATILREVADEMDPNKKGDNTK